jgi:hypothetical protein
MLQVQVLLSNIASYILPSERINRVVNTDNGTGESSKSVFSSFHSLDAEQVLGV